MASYSDSFSAYTAGTQPTGWSKPWGTTGTIYKETDATGPTASSVLNFSGGSDELQILTLDSVDGDANRDDVEILTKLQVDTNPGFLEETFQISGRVSGSAGSEYGYILGVIADDQHRVKITKVVNGTKTVLALNSAVKDYVADQWYMVRFRINGTSLKCKVWAEETSEPSTWLIDITDSSITGVGAVGLGREEEQDTKSYDYIVVATNGDTAAYPVGTGAIRTTQVSGEVLSTQANPIVWTTQVSLEVLIAAPAAAGGGGGGGGGSRARRGGGKTKGGGGSSSKKGGSSNKGKRGTGDLYGGKWWE